MSARGSAAERTAADLERAAVGLLPVVAELERALALEADALKSNDADALLGAAETKRRCLHEADAQLVRAGLVQADLTQAAFAHAGSAAAELLAALARCRQMNQAAGAAIAALRSHTEARVRLLGVSPEPATYGSSGRAEPRRSIQARILA
jgi:flagellar biosynthesis/type III secretory pathway chaperone